MNYLLTCALITSSISSDIRPIVPTEIYGPSDANLELLIGNGGAGPTCLIQALAEDFINQNELHIQIGWIQTISKLTLENLKEGVIDISLTYEESPELKAIEEGYASERTLIFNDHFILVGPTANSAGICKNDSVEDAFCKIAMNGSHFFSRDDHSGTNEKERLIWKALKLNPWETSTWYFSEHLFPADSLMKADREGCYTLTDRGTFLMKEASLLNTAVYIQNENALINRCHAMLQSNPKPYARLFLEYLKSTRAQELIHHYTGKACAPLFTQANEDQFLDIHGLE
jgi:tungstate transport system substrate-binding protein